MEIRLTEIDARVLGALIEKEITTPEYYPLSLNALVNACDQKSNREPVMNLSEEDVTLAMRRLSELELAGAANTTDSRVRKYEHRLQEAFNFTRPETAVLCVLLLRGAQTPGELRGRTERMHRFSDLEEVQAALHRLIERQPPLVKMLPRQPGTKESRYAHLLSGEPEGWEGPADVPAGLVVSPDGEDRIARLEAEVESLHTQVAELRRQFVDFRKQFE